MLKKVRIKNVKTVKEIAEFLNVSQMTVYNYENGKRKTPILVLKKLAELYKCEIDELIE